MRETSASQHSTHSHPEEELTTVPALIIAGAVVIFVMVMTSAIITTFLKSVDAGEILLASRGRSLRIFRGPCKALIIPCKVCVSGVNFFIIFCP